MTSIKVPKNLRDRLNALADERGRGTTLAQVLEGLLEDHETNMYRNRMAYMEVAARAQEDAEGMARAERQAEPMINYLRRREASQ
ncbi:hypothetical protein [Microtetraspora malaysiensis]|uniref:hypothetical protein n=1 Tax=Microtetraspora malaysiensis TaxID=161358 RepID=UPI0008360AB2|nr:hypothetical protein [Microtetraspora malaysiensis]